MARGVTKVLLLRFGECPVALAFVSGKCGRGTLNVLLKVGRILVLLFPFMPGKVAIKTNLFIRCGFIVFGLLCSSATGKTIA